MLNHLEPQREIPVCSDVDVAVAGAGPAGFAAAIAAARSGARVLLIEKENYVGGLLAALPILGFYNLQGRQLIHGIAQELVDRLVAAGGSPGHILDPRLASVTMVDSEALKIVAQQMVLEAGVDLLFHTLVCAPVADRGRVGGLVIENKSGRQAVLAKVVIDATGDGDVAARAGAEFAIRDKADQQPGTLMFRMGCVKVDKIRLAVAANPDNARTVKGVGPGADFFLAARRFVVDGFTEQMGRARAAGDLPPDYPMQWAIVIAMPQEDEVAINMAMATHFQSIDAADLSRAEIEGRRWIPIVVAFLKKYVPGFENAHLIASHSTMGVRESRRILGDYVLQDEDVVAGRSFPDGVAMAPWAPSAGHHPEGSFRENERHSRTYAGRPVTGCEIPYRCLLPRGIEGLLTAGRCISVTETSQNAMRVMAPCMALGQAAGTAAALAVRKGITPRRLDAAELRGALVAAGVRLMERAADGAGG